MARSGDRLPTRHLGELRCELPQVFAVPIRVFESRQYSGQQGPSAQRQINTAGPQGGKISDRVRPSRTQTPRQSGRCDDPPQGVEGRALIGEEVFFNVGVARAFPNVDRQFVGKKEQRLSGLTLPLQEVSGWLSYRRRKAQDVLGRGGSTLYYGKPGFFLQDINEPLPSERLATRRR